MPGLRLDFCLPSLVSTVAYFVQYTVTDNLKQTYVRTSDLLQRS
jgi:hypothetical protein